MEAERWRQTKALFEAVQAQAPETSAAPGEGLSRPSAFCGEVQSLRDQQADSFLESAPAWDIKRLSGCVQAVMFRSWPSVMIC